MSENFVSNSNANSLVTKVNERLALRPKTFTGSHDDWDNLTAAQQAEYQYVNFNDDNTDGYMTIEYDEWESMSDSEKAQIAKAIVVNAPGLDTGIEADLFTLLWENPNPTSAFAAQNITLASDEYDFLLTLAKINTSSNVVLSSITPKGNNIWLDYAASSANGSLVANRPGTYSSNKVYNFSSCSTATGTTASSTDNNRLIPVAIYGFKKKIRLNIESIGCEVFPQPRLFRLENYTLPTAVSIGQFGTAQIDTGKTLSQLTNGYLGNGDKKRTVIQLLYTTNAPMNLVNSYIGTGNRLYLELYNGFSNAQYITKIWLLIIAFPNELVTSVT